MQTSFERNAKDRVRTWTNRHLIKASVCANCGKPNIPCKCKIKMACGHRLHFHHLRYEKTQNAVITLCSRCHFSLHTRGKNNHNFRDALEPIKCNQCKKWFLDRIPRKFCSKKCANESLILKIKKKCENCGKTIEIIPYKLKKNKHLFCSLKCAYSSPLRTENQPARLPRKCVNCGKEMSITPYMAKSRKFVCCSRKCAAALHKRGGVNYSPTRKRKNTKIPSKCEICGKITMKFPDKVIPYRHHFCSEKCLRKGWKLWHWQVNKKKG